LPGVTRSRQRSVHDHRPHTIIGRFTELRTALQILIPDVDVGWVVRPFGPTIYAMLPKTTRPRQPPDSGVLLAWAKGIMGRAAAAPLTRSSGIDYRDGRLLALFASRGRRLRPMALLRLGHELVRRDGRYRLELAPDAVKTNVEDCIDLPADLAACIDHYVHVTRPMLRDVPSWVDRIAAAA
jgi:hypothetical protein